MFAVVVANNVINTLSDNDQSSCINQICTPFEPAININIPMNIR